MAIKVKFKKSDLDAFSARMGGRGLEMIGDAIAVTMTRQTDRAFRSSGQPSKNWPPLNPPKPSKRVAASQVLRTSQDKPLTDTGALAASFSVATPVIVDGKLKVTQSSSMAYANMHQHGIKTDGPNYIPLTRRGRLLHRNGANPKDEGLEQGVDYIIAWNGVDVPARPMIDFSDPVNKQEITDTVTERIGG